MELAGSCEGCPFFSVTLKQGVENMLKHHIAEVTDVVVLKAETEGGGDGGQAKEDSKEKQKAYEERLAQAGIPFSD